MSYYKVYSFIGFHKMQEFVEHSITRWEKIVAAYFDGTNHIVIVKRSWKEY